MQNFRTGLAFFKQAWGTARRKPALFKPGLYSLLAGFILTLFALIPIGLLIHFLGKTIPGMLLIGAGCAFLLAGQLAFSQFFSLMTTYLVYSTQSQAEPSMKAAWTVLRRAWFDTLTLSLAEPGIALQRRLSRAAPPNPAKPDRAWLSAAYLIVPVMVVENLGLKASLLRTSQMVTNNLLRSGENLLGVNAFNRLAGGLLEIAGIILGVLFGRFLGGLVGALTGIILVSLFILAAANLAAFSHSAYTTCLYQWAQRVEAAQQQNPPGEVLAPEMLAAAL
jgi:hypothetical protein